MTVYEAIRKLEPFAVEAPELRVFGNEHMEALGVLLKAAKQAHHVRRYRLTLRNGTSRDIDAGTVAEAIREFGVDCADQILTIEELER